MAKRLNSVYAEHIREFITLKRKLGYKYKVGEDFLFLIDDFADRRNETSAGFTKDFSEKWCEPLPKESHNYRYERIRHLLLFSSYLRDLGIDSYLPRLIPYKSNTYVPYIFTNEEIENLFLTIDQTIGGFATNKSSQLFSMPTLFRVLYATGIRVGEALALTNNDVNLREKFILIKDSKNGKERIIPISDSLVTVCLHFQRYKSHLGFPIMESDFFFISPNGNKCAKSVVRSWFKKSISKIQLSNSPSSGEPRVHDLRHTFAVRSLAHMSESGVDLYASLPVLSAYLGHQSIKATNHYVRLTASMYPNLVDQTKEILGHIYPKLQ